MKRENISIATLLFGIVFVLSLFFTDTIVYADVGEYKNVTSTVTIAGITKEEKNRIDELAVQINTDLNKKGYFKLTEKGTVGLFKKAQVKNLDFISTKSDTDNSKKKLNNEEVKTELYTVTLAANWDLYNAYDSTQKTEIYMVILSNIQSSKTKVSQGTKIKVYNYFIDNDSATSNLVRQLSTDVTADFVSAYSSLKNLKVFDKLSFILGLLAILIFLGLSLSILIDLAYIVIPTFQLLDNGKEPPLILIFRVSREAWDAVHESEKNEVKLSAVSIYFKSRVKQIFVISLCILYLTSGEIYSLLAWLIDSFQGFLPK